MTKNDRKTFVDVATSDGMSKGDARRLMELATILERVALTECNGLEAQSRTGRHEPCAEYCNGADACDRGDGAEPCKVHKREAAARAEVETICARVTRPDGKQFRPRFHGDPRGYVLKIMLPSGRYNTWGGAESGYGVPADVLPETVRGY